MASIQWAETESSHVPQAFSTAHVFIQKGKHGPKTLTSCTAASENLTLHTPMFQVLMHQGLQNTEDHIRGILAGGAHASYSSEEVDKGIHCCWGP
uniref:Uncharacterized protein n=1 Tax=Arundo donax TaxID=35708 RepID=A0A0A9D886_ARUDO